MISKINLVDYRNFIRKEIKFSNKETVIVGPNATGKTNILEAVYLLSSGKSFKARVEEEMINHDSYLSRVAGDLTTVDDGKIKLEVVLTRGEIEIGEEKYEKAPRKKLLVNGISRRLLDFSGKLKTVLFGPCDLDLVTESPSTRRRFLDAVLSLTDREYRRAALSYDKGLRQRNKLLFRIRDKGGSRSQLLFWDKLLIKNGNYISRAREDFLFELNKSQKVNNQTFKLEYDKSAISEGRLEEYAREEVAAATTLVGPHRDDFCFFIEKNGEFRDLARFGSRGEQRMGVLWLKISELLFVETRTGEKPTLLLDDIFSELDHKHRDVVFSIAKNQQTIITTADPHYLSGVKKVDRIDLVG